MLALCEFVLKMVGSRLGKYLDSFSGQAEAVCQSQRVTIRFYQNQADSEFSKDVG